MKVFGLALDENTRSPVLVLKDMDEKRVLPIWIGATEAMAISLVLNEVKLPRPMTHDLLLSTIGDLGGQVARVGVVRLDEGTFFAEIIVEQGDAVLHLDSRPSDAIALALRAGCSIRVDESVLEEAGTDSLPGMEGDLSGEDDRWTDLLNEFDEEESKYKM